MKRIKTLIASVLCIAALSFTGCSDDDNDKGTVTVTTKRVVSVEYDKATVRGGTSGSYSECGIAYGLNPSPTTADNKVSGSKGTEYDCELTGLTPGTIYYVRAYATKGGDTYYGEQKSFTTYEYGDPLMSDMRVDKVGNVHADVSVLITTDGGSKITESGFVYSQSAEPTVNDKKVVSDAHTMGRMRETITGLEDNEHYYVRAYLLVEGKTAPMYSLETEFTTAVYNLPKVEVTGYSDVASTSMKVNVSITTDNDLEITDRGIYYGLSSDRDQATKVESGTGAGTFTVELTGLEMGETYYVWAYAVNLKGTAVSAISSETTESTKPRVSGNITDIYTFSATGSLTIADLGVGEYAVEKIGFVWGESLDPTIENDKYVIFDDGDYSEGSTHEDIHLAWLKPGTELYVRAFAVNENDEVGYSNNLQIETREDPYSYIDYSMGAANFPYCNATALCPRGSTNTSAYVSAAEYELYASQAQKDVDDAMLSFLDSWAPGSHMYTIYYYFRETASGQKAFQTRFGVRHINGSTANTRNVSWIYRFERDADGFFRLDLSSENRNETGTNIPDMINSFTPEGEQAFIDYRTIFGGNFVMEWLTPTSLPSSSKTPAFRFISVDDPEKSIITCSYFSSTATGDLNDW